MTEKEKYMKAALSLAADAAKDGDVPVGCVIADGGGNIIGRGRNRREKNKNALCHAEIEAINSACKKLHSWRLDGCELYVTLEPCPMCAWAILQSRISTVYFGSYDVKYGAFGSATDLRMFSEWKPKVYGGILEKECDEILKKCFKKMREQSKI